MKVIINIVLAGLAIASLAFTSCRKVDIPQLVEPTDNKVSLVTSIEGAATNIGLLSTKATDPSGARTAFKLNDRIGVYVVPYKDKDNAGILEAGGNYVNNVYFEYIILNSQETWNSASPIFHPNMKSDIYGFAPYSASFTPGPNAAIYKVSVPADQSSQATVMATDIMTAKIEAQVATSAALSMKFFHRFSLINFNFSVPSTMQGKNIRSVKSVKLAQFALDADVDLIAPYTNIVNGSGAVNPKPATVSSGSPKTTIIPHMTSDGVVGNPATFYKYEAIVVPQSMAGGTGFIEIELEYTNSSVVKYYYKVPEGKTQDFLAGCEQNINLTFAEDAKLLLGEVTIAPWGTTAAIGGEVVETKVFNDFTLNLATGSATQIASVKVLCNDGYSEGGYSLQATHTAGSKVVKFAFDGSKVSPEYYPYTIKNVEFYDGSGAKITAITDTYVKQLTAKGPAILRPGAWSANCYVLSPGGSVRINAVRAGNDLADASDYSKSLVSSIKSVRILWQTAQGHVAAGAAGNMSLASVVLADSVATVTATAGGAGGNAVIAAFDAVAGGNILWSWHIWVSPADVATMTKPAYGPKFTMANGLDKGIMDRNLGAISATKEVSCALTAGMVYQWGRKDPFIGSDGTQPIKVFTATATEKTDNVGWASGSAVINATNDKSFSFLMNSSKIDNVTNAVRNPMTYYGSDGITLDNTWTSPLDFKLWTSSENCSSPLGAPNKGPKALYDPCPAGYRVATGGIEGYGTWGDLGLNGGKYGTVSGAGITSGFTYGELAGSPWYPIETKRVKDTGATIIGQESYCWSASIYMYNSPTMLTGITSTGLVNTSHYGMPSAWGHSVRCVQD